MRFTGIAAAPGSVRGKIWINTERLPAGFGKAAGDEVLTVPQKERELAAVGKALEQTADELDLLYAEADRQAGPEAALIFRAYQGILSDVEYKARIEEEILRNGKNGREAVQAVGTFFADMFLKQEDKERQTRFLDIAELTGRVLSHIAGDGTDHASDRPVRSLPMPDGLFILVAYDLSASNMIRLGKERLLGVVLIGGSVLSHTALLAKGMKIPMAVCVRPEQGQTEDDYTALLSMNGEEGELTVSGEDASFIVGPGSGGMNNSEKGE